MSRRAVLTMTISLAAGAALQAGAQTSGTVLLVRVGDATTGAFLPSVEVRIADTRVATRTDTLGEARLPGIRAGTYRVEARRLGYAPLSVMADLSGRDSAELVLLLQPVAHALQAVTVQEMWVSPGMRGFEERRQRHIGGYFVTGDQLKAHGHSLVLAFATRIPGARIEISPTGRGKVFSTRGQNSSGSACQVAVYADGVRLSDGDPLIWPPEWIAGMEYYPPGFVPVRYREPAMLELSPGGKSEGYRGGSSACGVLLLWSGG